MSLLWWTDKRAPWDRRARVNKYKKEQTRRRISHQNKIIELQQIKIAECNRIIEKQKREIMELKKNLLPELMKKVYIRKFNRNLN